MPGFDRLDPALQHHIVNSLGWRSLRPLQEAAIDPVLDGEHALLLAPTAGGKTEAAIFPVLSRMLTEEWSGVSVLYVCPIKALLNNLEIRLDHYARLLGRRAALWHGDVTSTARQRILREPPEILLTTPESIEVMLASTRVEEHALLGNARCVIVDELHAFAGDDRGWHLLAVLERLDAVAGRPLQRLGLSATIGNPEELLRWLTVERDVPRRVLAPSAGGAAAEIDVVLDHVGHLDNAATVISRLHRGEKRLVFVDSRARVETLATRLRELDVRTFVSHSSLSVDERRQAEAAFAQERDAVIVATSTLELGIDVGDLDRVIQIDAPATVASFLQRIGRTGRRSGTVRNCLFLTTTDTAFLRACGLLHLWEQGWVEPVVPPATPYHLAAQQLLASCLQHGHVSRGDPFADVAATLACADVSRADQTAIVDHCLAEDILFDEGGLLSISVNGERLFGRRHFLELMSVFTSDPLFRVRHGQVDLGHVHPVSFERRGDRPAVLSLAGRSWKVRSVDWSQRVAWVEPTSERGRSQWMGSARGLGFELCQAMAAVLAGADPGVDLSKRAAQALAEARAERPWIEPDRTTFVRDGEGWRWWTFAGLRANLAIRAALPSSVGASSADDLSLKLEQRPVVNEVDVTRARVDVTSEELEALKFHQALPARFVEALVRGRGVDVEAGERVVGWGARTLDDEPSN